MGDKSIPTLDYQFIVNTSYDKGMSEKTERDLAMFMDMVFLGRCEQLWVFGSNISKGMAAEIEKAKQKKMKIRYFMEDCMEVK